MFRPYIIKLRWLCANMELVLIYSVPSPQLTNLEAKFLILDSKILCKEVWCQTFLLLENVCNVSLTDSIMQVIYSCEKTLSAFS